MSVRNFIASLLRPAQPPQFQYRPDLMVPIWQVERAVGWRSPRGRRTRDPLLRKWRRVGPLFKSQDAAEAHASKLRAKRPGELFQVKKGWMRK